MASNEDSETAVQSIDQGIEQDIVHTAQGIEQDLEPEIEPDNTHAGVAVIDFAYVTINNQPGATLTDPEVTTATHPGVGLGIDAGAAVLNDDTINDGPVVPTFNTILALSTNYVERNLPGAYRQARKLSPLPAAPLLIPRAYGSQTFEDMVRARTPTGAAAFDPEPTHLAPLTSPMITAEHQTGNRGVYQPPNLRPFIDELRDHPGPGPMPMADIRRNLANVVNCWPQTCRPSSHHHDIHQCRLRMRSGMTTTTTTTRMRTTSIAKQPSQTQR